MYSLVKNNRKFKYQDIIELIGYECKINKYKIIIYEQQLIDKYINSKLSNEYNKLIRKILLFIEGDNDSDDSELYLEELAKFYNIFINNDGKYLSSKAKDKYLNNIRLLSNELKKYHLKKYLKVDNVKKGRSK